MSNLILKLSQAGTLVGRTVSTDFRGDKQFDNRYQTKRDLEALERELDDIRHRPVKSHHEELAENQ